uniref:Ig-like domain-containing protein n=1 Tax=Amphiprion ocellaris TaxID=80972 RepID=A0A3Q1CB54_AMPOC
MYSSIIFSIFFLYVSINNMLFVIFPDNSVIFEKVLEGNSATLDPGIETLQKDHTVRWTKGLKFLSDQIFINETFKDVLQLNERTGALTINRMTRSLEGFYCVKNLWGTDPHILRKYLVMVYELVPKPQISSAPANFTQTDGICSVSCSARNAPEVFLSWYQGEKKIIEISDSDISVNLTLPLQIQSQPEVIYTCRAANPVSDATVMLNSTDWCPPHHSGELLWVVLQKHQTVSQVLWYVNAMHFYPLLSIITAVWPDVVFIINQLFLL